MQFHNFLLKLPGLLQLKHRSIPMKMPWLAFTAFSLAFLAGGSADARQWNPDVHASALDYAQIFHARPTGEIVLLWWVVPEIFMPNANNQSLLNVLSRYVVVGVAQGRPGANGAVAFEKVPALQITDAASRTYSPLPDNMLPADVAQAIGSLRGLASQSPIGPIAQGMRWLVYQVDTIHSCMPGKMSVPLGGETYTYDTPIPGCVK
jgi:hypothetical protein